MWIHRIRDLSLSLFRASLRDIQEQQKANLGLAVKSSLQHQILKLKNKITPSLVTWLLSPLPVKVEESSTEMVNSCTVVFTLVIQSIFLKNLKTKRHFLVSMIQLLRHEYLKWKHFNSQIKFKIEI